MQQGMSDCASIFYQQRINGRALLVSLQLLFSLKLRDAYLKTLYLFLSKETLDIGKVNTCVQAEMSKHK